MSGQAGLFIGANDTDAGKTYITARILEALNHHKIRAQPRKPLATGCQPSTPGHWQCPDTRILHQAWWNNNPFLHLATAPTDPQTLAEQLHKITPFAFAPAVSPHNAMAQAGVEVSLEQLVKACNLDASECLILEGVGGMFSPINNQHLNIHLLLALQLPLILVIENRLGAINQALSQVSALSSYAITPEMLLINNPKPQQTDHTQGLESFTNIPVYRLDYGFGPRDLPNAIIHLLRTC